MYVPLMNTNAKCWNVIFCCADCVTKGLQSLTNDTLYFMNTLNQTLTCFEKYQQVCQQLCAMVSVCLWVDLVSWDVSDEDCCSLIPVSEQGNQSELCTKCKEGYRGLNVLYSLMEENGTMCIDIEDEVCMPVAEVLPSCS